MNEKQNISPRQINSKYMKIVEEAIREVELNGVSVPNATEISGKKIDPEDQKKYTDLLILKDILKIENHEVGGRNSVFEDFFIPQKDINEFFRIIRDNDTGIKFPQYIQEVGVIPDYCFDKKPDMNVLAPFPLKYKETIEHYEKRLALYYKNIGIEVEVDENGIRKPYPHEKCGWVNCKPVDKGRDYTSPYYNKYKASKLRSMSYTEEPEQTQTQTNEQEPAKPYNFKDKETVDPNMFAGFAWHNYGTKSSSSSSDSEAQENTQSQTNTSDSPIKNTGATTSTNSESAPRNPIDVEYSDTRYKPNSKKKHRVKEKRSLLDGIKLGFKKLKSSFISIDRTLASDNTWRNIGKVIKGIVIGGGAIAITAFLGKNILLNAGKILLAGALNPIQAAAFIALVAAAVGLPIYAVKKRIERNREAQRIAEEEEAEKERKKNEEESKSKGKGKDNDLGNDGPTMSNPNPTPSPVPPRGTPTPTPKPSTPTPTPKPTAPTKPTQNPIQDTIKGMKTSAEVEAYLGSVIGDMNGKRREIKAEREMLDLNSTITPEEKAERLRKLDKNNAAARNIQFKALDAFILSQELTMDDVKAYGGRSK